MSLGVDRACWFTCHRTAIFYQEPFTDRLILRSGGFANPRGDPTSDKEYMNLLIPGTGGRGNQ